MLMIVGPPGAGKSVQAQLIEDEANVKWLSTGQLLRDHKDNLEAEKMEKGVLVDDSVVEDVLHRAIEGVSNGTRILIDGFPRTDSQVQWFRGYTRAARRDLVAIVHIKVSQDEVLKRLKERGRADDKKRVVKNRYKSYEEEIVPMVEHMAKQGTEIIEVDGNRTVEQVHTDIMNSLKGKI